MGLFGGHGLIFDRGLFCQRGTRFFAVGPGSKAVQCFDGTGNCLWLKETDRKIQRVLPSPSGDHVIVSTEGRNAVLLGPDGNTNWQRRSTLASAGIDERMGRVYLPDEKYRPSAVDFGGNVCWTANLGSDANCVQMTCSEDGSRVFAPISMTSKVACFDASGNVLPVIDSPGNAYGIVVSRDGTNVAWLAANWHLAYPNNGWMFLCDVDGDGNARKLGRIDVPGGGFEGALSGFAITDASGRTLLFSSYRVSDTLVFRDGCEMGRVPVRLWALSQDGRVAAGITKRDSISCWDVSSSPPSKVLEEGDLGARPVLLHLGESDRVCVALYNPRTQAVSVRRIPVR